MTSHDASASAIGYLYQVRWALLELLRGARRQPDMSLTLEKLDDVAWQDVAGDPVEALQLKHHKVSQGSPTDMSPDMWRTLRVWIDEPRFRDAAGPQLTLLTTAVAPHDSAAWYLRSEDRNIEMALSRLDHAAVTSEDKTTHKAREAWRGLTDAERLGILHRLRILDGEVRIEGLDEALEKEVWVVAPRERTADFLAELDAWWLRVAIDLLRGARGAITGNELKAKIDDVRDRFLPDNLITIETRIDEHDAMVQYGSRPFVRQLEWIDATPVMLRHAVMDFHRAVTQTTEWLDRNLLEMTEFDNFKEALTDEWEVAFDDMIDDLPEGSTEEDRRRAGKQLYRKLRDAAVVQVRPRYTETFYARGVRHEIADGYSKGWHPDFELLVESLTIGTTE